MRGSGLKYDGENGREMCVLGYIHILMVPTLDFDEAAFFVRVEIGVEGIQSRDVKQSREQGDRTQELSMTGGRRAS